MKKFLKKTEGFTLVELIVVIAILGILTAIAVPVYSGYVTKASEANDTQVLSSMNTAIAAACTEYNVEIKDVSTYLDFESNSTDAKKAGCTVTVTAKSGDTATKIFNSFKTYSGEDDGKFDFKYYTDAQPDSTDATVPDGNLVGVAPVK